MSPPPVFAGPRLAGPRLAGLLPQLDGSPPRAMSPPWVFAAPTTAVLRPRRPCLSLPLPRKFKRNICIYQTKWLAKSLASRASILTQ